MSLPPISMSVEGRSCSIHFFGTPYDSRTPVIVLPVASGLPEVVKELHKRLDPVIAAGEAAPYLLAAFQTADWNDDLSPWPALTPNGRQRAFGGQGKVTLYWILERFLPQIEEAAPCARKGGRGLLGYSMAGLFAVWALSQTAAFSVFGSCSGSLWYPEFCERLRHTGPKGSCCVYLSLGEREELSRNRWFSSVGDATRQTAALLKGSPLCRELVLAWNPGGHTADVVQRLAAAQLWMRQRL